MGGITDYPQMVGSYWISLGSPQYLKPCTEWHSNWRSGRNKDMQLNTSTKLWSGCGWLIMVDFWSFYVWGKQSKKSCEKQQNKPINLRSVAKGSWRGASLCFQLFTFGFFGTQLMIWSQCCKRYHDWRALFCEGCDGIVRRRPGSTLPPER